MIRFQLCILWLSLSQVPIHTWNRPHQEHFKPVQKVQTLADLLA